MNWSSSSSKPSSGASSASASQGAAPFDAHLKIVNCPNNDLALTNCVFLSPADASKLPFLLAGEYVFTAQPYRDFPPGQIGLNAIQRRLLRVSTGESIPVSRFDPPAHKFDLELVECEMEFVTKAKKVVEQVDAVALGKTVTEQFHGQVFTVGQKLSVDYRGTTFVLTVLNAVAAGVPDKSAHMGRLLRGCSCLFQAAAGTGIKIGNQRAAGAVNMLFKTTDFSFEKLGIGGLDKEFELIFRRAFASRVFSPQLINKLGIKHTKGMLLHGPPGTGKTLIARQIGKMLNGKEPKVVNGPEILNKYVGESEKNIRDLFADAEKDQKANGDSAELHIIIFDEIDAICKSRGSARDSTGVNDSIVNQLLTKIDGVEALNNILLIGMTNRKDMLDEALLRPGRLEVLIEIGLPDEAGRHKILQIHSNKMKENSFMGQDVDLSELAQRTKNFSGAELEGLVRAAVSFALTRQTNPSDLTKTVDEENVRVTMADFRAALSEMKPAFGANTRELNQCRMDMLDCLPKHNHILEIARQQVAQLRTSNNTHLLSMLLEGEPGSGKTALAATIAIDSGFPFVKLVSAESMVGISEPGKTAYISKAFDDAYKSKFSIVILDDVERLLGYVSLGNLFSNVVLQALLVLAKKKPPEDHKILVIATTSLSQEMQQALHLDTAFQSLLNVPSLNKRDMSLVLSTLECFRSEDIIHAVDDLGSLHTEMTIKKLLLLLERARQDAVEDPGQMRRIPLSKFHDSLRNYA